MSLTRFGVSLEENLLNALDGYVKDNNFPNRSQAIRYLVEKNLVEKKWMCNHIVAGAIVLLYDPHKKDIANKINEIQFQYFEDILSSQVFHLNAETCLAIIAVKGTANNLTLLSDRFISIKGIAHGKLIMSRV
jgi:CopG family transcriptional regulator, nickel-responsive regulator